MSNPNIVTFEKKVDGNPMYDEELTRAPWDIGIQDFSSTDQTDLIDQTLQLIKKKHIMLVLASPEGERYCNTILINYDTETLNIDKPMDWDDRDISTFRIFFQDATDIWSFFEVSVITDCPYSLCATYPEALHRLVRRKHYRIGTPQGTRAVFWHGNNIYDGGFVKDISAAGMLICTGKDEEQFNGDHELLDIAIALPQKLAEAGLDEERTLLPVIHRGRIVRSFRDQETNWVCHGISFDDSNPEVADRLDEFVKSRTADSNES
ncbi:MAG: PilZ domain-containing protein [Proteobacteria bacterium]|nr:PilZ domain-containing protein [Pseudomonadota bacterium]MBU1688961.1 PilZ domain-containing protein [Pseudomonadota bacterium]